MLVVTSLCLSVEWLFIILNSCILVRILLLIFPEYSVMNVSGTFLSLFLLFFFNTHQLFIFNKFLILRGRYRGNSHLVFVFLLVLFHSCHSQKIIYLACEPVNSQPRALCSNLNNVKQLLFLQLPLAYLLFFWIVYYYLHFLRHNTSCFVSRSSYF